MAAGGGYDTFRDVELYTYDSASYLVGLNGGTRLFVSRDSVVSAVEAVNAAHLGQEGRRMNQRAFQYAQMFDLPVTAGSDSHHTRLLYGGGVETPGRMEKPTDYLRWMQEGKLKLLGE